jgi:hypothetical protein
VAYVQDPQDLNQKSRGWNDPNEGAAVEGGNAFQRAGTDIKNWLNGTWKSISGRNDYRAPENVFNPMGAYDSTKPDQSRANQTSSYGSMGQPNSYYQGLMNGSTPSLANAQMKQGIAQANVQGMQAASGAHGIDRAAAFRQAQNNAAGSTAQGAIAGGQQRLQEQQLGAQGYSQGLQAQNNMASTQRQQDIGEQQGNLGLQNQAQSNLNNQYAINAGVTNANAANGQKGAGGIMQLGAGALAALSDERAKEDIKPAGQSYAARAPGVEANRPGTFGQLAQGLRDYGGTLGGSGTQGGGDGRMFGDADVNNITKAFGGGSGASDASASGGATDAAGMGGGMGGGASDATSAMGAEDVMSDERSKEALKGVHPFQFDYKDGPAHTMAMQAAHSAYAQAFADAKTPRTGVMAQDMLRTPEGSQVVQSTPQGLQLEGKRALGFMLANQADFNDRLSAVERGKGKRA